MTKIAKFHRGQEINFVLEKKTQVLILEANLLLQNYFFLSFDLLGFVLNNIKILLIIKYVKVMMTNKHTTKNPITSSINNCTHGKSAVGLLKYGFPLFLITYSIHQTARSNEEIGVSHILSERLLIFSLYLEKKNG